VLHGGDAQCVDVREHGPRPWDVWRSRHGALRCFDSRRSARPCSTCRSLATMKTPHDATDLSRARRDVARDSRVGPGSLERLDRARERLVRWREALEAAGFRTNLSLIPPCSLAARHGDATDDRWVTVLPTGLIALERHDLGEAASTWSRATEQDGEPSIDDVLRAVRALFARGLQRSRHVGHPGGTGTSLDGGTSNGHGSVLPNGIGPHA